MKKCDVLKSVMFEKTSDPTRPDPAMSAIATAALTLPISLSRSNKFNSKRCVKGGFGVFAIIGEESGLVARRSSWTTLFDVADPRSNAPQYKGKFIDVNQALELARYDLQYCDWRARQDVLTIMLLHEKVVEVLNPLAREFKSIGTLKKELAELQEELARAHNQVHISEARVSTALEKLAYMETLVNDKIMRDQKTTETPDKMKSKKPRKNLNVSGPVQPYNDRLKNFWYPVAFSSDLKDNNTMVLNEDLRLVLGQQERMLNGANVWNWPVSYDKLGVRYRLWRDFVENGESK
ncbi:chlorophyllide a oxygenase [Striga asiatica]|uniref:Chlorophyllide a oxygenase n=1 Tax=Striga asiatica TaxID=4170 RepID=A0A5A7QW76_STRAF|nr:chlorophyllide a oxygenase [Striga asiatica]